MEALNAKVAAMPVPGRTNGARERTCPAFPSLAWLAGQACAKTTFGELSCFDFALEYHDLLGPLVTSQMLHAVQYHGRQQAVEERELKRKKEEETILLKLIDDAAMSAERRRSPYVIHQCEYLELSAKRRLVLDIVAPSEERVVDAAILALASVMGRE